MLTSWTRLPPRQSLTLLLVVALAIAAAVGAWLWAQPPDYRVLYSNLSDRDGGAIIAALGQMNVPYKFADGGGVDPGAGQPGPRDAAALASQGLPKGGVVGFELVDNQKFGTTQFQEQINYQRGLEGELARSIQSLAAVQSARVHLAIPKPVGVPARCSSSRPASVLLNLHPGRTLDQGQVSGIAHLVASSVPELRPRPRQHRRPERHPALAAPRRHRQRPRPAQLGYVKQIEQATIQRIVDILEPLVGR